MCNLNVYKLVLFECCVFIKTILLIIWKIMNFGLMNVNFGFGVSVKK